ncbi:hypothetical protein [Brucella thiophenivorans]|nr:hypothetical protein [Brucella thiophenivorans]
MAQSDNDKQLPKWLNIRKREKRAVKPDPENRPFTAMRAFSRRSLWMSTALGAVVSFFLFSSAFQNISTSRMTVTSQMGRLRSVYRWPDDWGFFSTIVGLKLLAGVIFLIATVYCLKAAFRLHDK